MPSESTRNFKFRVWELNDRLKDEPSRKTPPQKLLTDLLKRQARAAMADVTRCQPNAIAANVARLQGLCDLFEHFIRHDLAETPEASLSGRQLMYPTTLADFLACMESTWKHHRCPEFVVPEQDNYEEIIRRLDTLAFFISQNSRTNQIHEEAA